METEKCFEMRDQFVKYVQNYVSQILITSHSPVYYNITGCQPEGSKFSILHVTNDKGAGTCAEDASNKSVEELGIVARLADVYKKVEDDRKRGTACKLK